MKLPRWLGPGAVAFLLVWLVLLGTGRTAFFRSDPGTFAGQWLGEVGMVLTHRAGGYDTQLLGAVTLIASVFAWLAVRLLRTGLHPIFVWSVIALSLTAAGSHFHVRPQLFTFAALAVVTALLADTDVARPKLKRLLWLIPLCALWTNIHGGVLGGIGTLGIAFVGWIIVWKLGRPGPLKTWRDVGLLALVACGCGLSTLASPYGLDMVKELRESIAEHSPFDVTAPSAWPVLALAALYLFVLYGVKRSALRVAWLLPLVWMVFAFSRCRHASVFAVVALVTITAMWKHTRWALWLAAYRPGMYQPGSAESRPWWAHMWLPTLAVLLALSLQMARVPVPLIGSNWVQHDPKR